MRIFDNYRSNVPVLRAMGRALCQHVDAAGNIFGKQFGEEERRAAMRAIKLYNSSACHCRRAVALFLMFARAELSEWINGDIRKLIGTLVWKDQFAWLSPDD